MSCCIDNAEALTRPSVAGGGWEEQEEGEREAGEAGGCVEGEERERCEEGGGRRQ